MRSPCVGGGWCGIPVSHAHPARARPLQPATGTDRHLAPAGGSGFDPDEKTDRALRTLNFPFSFSFFQCQHVAQPDRAPIVLAILSCSYARPVSLALRALTQEDPRVRQIALISVVVPFLLLVPAIEAQDAPPSLAAAVQAYAEKKGLHQLPLFQHALVDLDGDGHADAIVLLQGSNWCGSGGCNMLVFHSTEDGFTFVSGSTITSKPIRVSADKTADWKTLIVYSKGRGDVLMCFNGTRYPLNPSVQPMATPDQIRVAQVVLE